MIYHYTNQETLLHLVNSIVDSSKGSPPCFMFHATHVAYMNDPSENRLLKEVLTSMNIKKSIVDLCFSLTGTSYVISFCNRNDNLPMWCLYGDNAAGVALGFDEKEILEYYKLSS